MKLSFSLLLPHLFVGSALAGGGSFLRTSRGVEAVFAHEGRRSLTGLTGDDALRYDYLCNTTPTLDSIGFSFSLLSVEQLSGTTDGAGEYVYTYEFADCRDQMSPDLSHWNLIPSSTNCDITSGSAPCYTNAGSGGSLEFGDGSCNSDINTEIKCGTENEGDQYGTMQFTVTNVLDPLGGIWRGQSKPGNSCAGFSPELPGPTCGEDSTPGEGPVCGDGIFQTGETCEFFGGVGRDIDEVAVDNCRSDSCTYCGDGTVDVAKGETCDGGLNARGEPVDCRGTCTYCGDDVVDSVSGETCDSGDDACVSCQVNTCACGGVFSNPPTLSAAPGDLTLDCSAAAETPVIEALDCNETALTVMFNEETLTDGTVVRTWSATDCAGQMTTHTQQITFEDTTDPVFENFPNDLTLECDNEIPGASVMISDDCDTAPQLAGPVEDDTQLVNGLGTILRTWTATDESGNSVSLTQSITIQDTTVPNIEGVPVDNDLKCEDMTPDVPEIVVSDNCQDITATLSEDSTRSATCNGVGTVTRTWTAIDFGGNSVTETQILTFSDNTAPVLTGLPSDEELQSQQTIQCGDDIPEVSAGAVDQCDMEVTVIAGENDQRGAECAGVGMYERSWTATDCSENTVSKSQTINFVDTEAPTLNAPADKTLECKAPIPNATVTAEDRCDTEVTITSHDPSDSRGLGDQCEGLGEYIRSWTATDCSGNSVAESQTLTFEDTTEPQLLDVPNDSTIQCHETIPVADVRATDSCDGELTVGDPVEQEDYDTCGLGTFTRTWTVADCAGNSDTQTSTVTVVDEVAPQFSNVPDNITQRQCGMGVPEASVGVSDNCDTSVQVGAPSIREGRDTCGVGTYARTWEVMDCAGNAASTTQTIEFVDTVAPQIVNAPGDMTLECDASIPNADAIAADDACDSGVQVSAPSVVDSRDTCNVGTYQRTWTATDCTGNSATAQQTIAFRDSTPPILRGVPADSVIRCGADTSPVPTVTSTDNCGPSPTVSSSDVVDTDSLPGAVITRTWRAEDCAGLSSTKNEVVTVLDTCEFTVNSAFSGIGLDVKIEVDNIYDPAGGVVTGVKMSVSVVDGTYVGDIRGVFFELSAGAVDGITSVEGPHVGTVLIQEDSVDRVANDVSMKGGGKNAHVYDVGVEIGTRGISKDDIAATEFTVSGITTDDVVGDFGIRLTSVGVGRNREQSSKIFGPAVCCRA